MKSEMEKEIYSQKSVIDKITKHFQSGIKIDFEFEEIKFIASGSSYNASRLGRNFFEIYTDKRATFEYASEFISNTDKKIKKDTLYCFVSQSGETYDTKCAMEIVKNSGGKTLAVVNNSNSTIYNNCDFKIDVMAGAENSIAATKSFLACVLCLWIFSISCSNKPKLSIPHVELKEASAAVEDVLKNIDSIDKTAKMIQTKKKLSIIGYGYGYILAKEGALKIKETSFIDASAYPTGEFLHGHTAVLNKNKMLIEIFTDKMSAFEENTLFKIKNDFNPKIIAITDKEADFPYSIKFKKYNYDISKICAITVILQLLALKTALYSGADVDKPHGLNKIVSG